MGSDHKVQSAGVATVTGTQGGLSGPQVFLPPPRCSQALKEALIIEDGKIKLELRFQNQERERGREEGRGKCDMEEPGRQGRAEGHYSFNSGFLLSTG